MGRSSIAATSGTASGGGSSRPSITSGCRTRNLVSVKREGVRRGTIARGVGRGRTLGWELRGRRREMKPLTRITRDPAVMGGRPCIRGLRVTVGTLVGLVASGHDATEILRLYPYLEAEDIREALAYAAWRSEEIEVPTPPP